MDGDIWTRAHTIHTHDVCMCWVKMKTAGMECDTFQPQLKAANALNNLMHTTLYSHKNHSPATREMMRIRRREREREIFRRKENEIGARKHKMMMRTGTPTYLSAQMYCIWVICFGIFLMAMRWSNTQAINKQEHTDRRNPCIHNKSIRAMKMIYSFFWFVAHASINFPPSTTAKSSSILCNTL